MKNLVSRQLLPPLAAYSLETKAQMLTTSHALVSEQGEINLYCDGSFLHVDNPAKCQKILCRLPERIVVNNVTQPWIQPVTLLTSQKRYAHCINSGKSIMRATNQFSDWD